MLFPGQGSQYTGMLSSFFKKNNSILTKTFDEASHYIQFNLLKIIQEGPNCKINESQYTQPIILTSSVALYRLWRHQNGKNPFFMSGHSLGEYSALVCADSINFSDALKIVHLRGKIMQKNVMNRPSLMQAIIGLDEKKVKKACLMASNYETASLASINSKDQIVISGDKKAVYKAGLYCKEYGAKSILNLIVNVPAHCKLMKPIAKKFEKILKIIKIHPPKISVINNVDVKCEKTEKKIKNALIRQLYSVVRWKEIIEFMQNKKKIIMLEVGPNKILTNLNKNHKNIVSLNTNTLNSFMKAFKKIN